MIVVLFSRVTFFHCIDLNSVVLSFVVLYYVNNKSVNYVSHCFVPVVLCYIVFAQLHRLSRARHHLASATPPVDMSTIKPPTRVRIRGR